MVLMNMALLDNKRIIKVKPRKTTKNKEEPNIGGMVMKHMRKRVLASIIAAMLVCSMLSISALAVDDSAEASETPVVETVTEAPEAAPAQPEVAVEAPDAADETPTAEEPTESADSEEEEEPEDFEDEEDEEDPEDSEDEEDEEDLEDFEDEEDEEDPEDFEDDEDEGFPEDWEVTESGAAGEALGEAEIMEKSGASNTPNASNTSAESGLPQTGQNWMTICVLAIAGVVVLLLGCVMNRRKADDET